MSVHGTMSNCPANGDNGKAFYAHLFTAAPAVRVFFKGAENFTGDDVLKSDRFAKLGEGFIKELGGMTAVEGDALKAKVRALSDRHNIPSRKVTNDLWTAIIPIWVTFLDKKKAMSAAEKTAWEAWGKNFATIAAN